MSLSNRPPLSLSDSLNASNHRDQPTSGAGGEAYPEGSIPMEPIGYNGSPDADGISSSGNGILDAKKSPDKWTKLLMGITGLLLILCIILFALVVDAQARIATLSAKVDSAPSASSTTAAGSTSGAAVVNIPSGVSSQSAAAFTADQWQALNETINIMVKTRVGPPGRDGANGRDGLNGTNGIDGRNGLNGMDGKNGAPGPNGTCLGVIGINDTIVIGGYYGWYWRGAHQAFKHLYPFAEVQAKVGDVLAFKPPHPWTPTQVVSWYHDDVFQFENLADWESCNFADNSTAQQLCTREDIRDGGFHFQLYPHHEGKTLYFASGRDFTHSDPTRRRCNRGLKVKVNVARRLEIPVRFTHQQADDSQLVLQLKNTMAKMGRLAILNQFQFEQRVRSEGQSGLTDVRSRSQGNKGYNDGHFVNGAIASIHNHADSLRIVGIGEIQGVLNGVEFQTRHNDYSLRMPHRTESGYHKTENVPLPDVPPEVLNKTTVQEQIKEMQEWFRAFKNQDWSVRDYRKYFKPILCYLEGTWLKETLDLTDPFLSERHQIDASTWKELHAKMRFMSNTGRKNIQENLAFLPSAVRSMLNDTWPEFANWEYRILCSPLKNDIPTQRFRVANDLSTQLRSSPITRAELHFSRAARFELNVYTNGNDPTYPTLKNGKQTSLSWPDTPRNWDYLDYLMEQIPGKDNYRGDLNDTLAGKTLPAQHYYPDNGRLNAAYYSRFYSVAANDAMGAARHRRSFHDAYMFAARTSQSVVSEVNYWERVFTQPGCTNINRCPSYEQHDSSKWSYAIPMEVIYLTPLTKWNPYNVSLHTNRAIPTANGRNGICKFLNASYAHKALDGTSDVRAFFTPSQFFAAGETAGAGDTSGGDTCVLDQTGELRRMRASGHWIVFPPIGGGVGKVRQRYPIMPIHEMGSTSWKELKALQELTLANDYDTTTTGYFGDSRDNRFGFTVEVLGGTHQHFARIPGWKVRQWTYSNGTIDRTGAIKVTVDTDLRNGHDHTVELQRFYVNNAWEYRIYRCKVRGEPDSSYQMGSCSDGHGVAVRST